MKTTVRLLLAASMLATLMPPALADASVTPQAAGDEAASLAADRASILAMAGTFGWIHWQDNIKMGPVDGKLAPFVQESVLNSYQTSADYDVQAGDAYWAATSDYWAAVRAEWDAVIKRGSGVTVAEVAETGSASGVRLMGFADDVQAKTLTTPAAIAKARAVIAEVTGNQGQD